MSAPEIERRSPDETQDADSHAILEALDKTPWNKAKAARLLGIDRVTLYRKVKKSLESDYPHPYGGALRPIHGFATAISERFFRHSQRTSPHPEGVVSMPE